MAVSLPSTTMAIASRTLGGRPGPAVVVSAGKMQKTVKCRQMKQIYDRHLRKDFYKPVHFLVHDENDSILEGDVITTARSRHSRHVHHTLDSIIAPFGKPIEARPKVLSAEERQALYDEKRKAKVLRRASRHVGKATKEARIKGWTFVRDTEQKETPKDDLGRSPLPGGLHRFGGKGEGGLHKESVEGSRKVRKRFEKGRQHELEREEIENTPSEEIARERLASGNEKSI